MVKRAKKVKKILMVKKIKEPLLSKALALFTVLLLLFVSAFCIKSFLSQSPIFSLKSVETRGAEGLISYKEEDILNSYLEENIFKIDLQGVAHSLMEQYPEFKDIVVHRVLPDRLFLDVTLRQPVALVRDRRYIPVDDEGVLLADIDSSTWEKLPVILGFDVSRKERLKKRCQSKRLMIALELLAEIEKSGLLAEHNLNSIDTVNYRNISFFLEDGLEVRIGNENFKERLAVLKKVLKDPNIILSRIKYIDLRFEDVVIGPK